MWNYTETVLDHFRNPRNVGRVENPDGVGEVGSLACGDALTLTFKLDENRRIADVKFQTFGCASAIASSSALTELVKGKTLEEAEKITNREIAEFLGGLPDQKMHCSVMGREALEAAIYNYRTGKPGNRIKEDRVVCTCFGVTESEIRRVITENDLATVEAVTNFTKAGGGCGKCIPEIEKMIAEERGKRRPSTAAPDGEPSKKPLTNLQKIKRIEDVIEKQVRPALRKDGGDLELIDVDGNEVIVAFRGMCAGCQASAMTRTHLVQGRLRECVSPELTVVEAKENEA